MTDYDYTLGLRIERDFDLRRTDVNAITLAVLDVMRYEEEWISGVKCTRSPDDIHVKAREIMQALTEGRDIEGVTIEFTKADAKVLAEIRLDWYRSGIKVVCKEERKVYHVVQPQMYDRYCNLALVPRIECGDRWGTAIVRADGGCRFD